jgi:hypothetical protein
MLPAAPHHCAIEGGFGFLVEARPASARQALRERSVWRLKVAVHVKIFIPRCIRVVRIEAPADEQTNGEADCGDESLHDGRNLIVAKFHLAKDIGRRFTKI